MTDNNEFVPTFIVKEGTRVAFFNPIDGLYHVFEVTGENTYQIMGVQFCTFAHPSHADKGPVIQ